MNHFLPLDFDYNIEHEDTGNDLNLDLFIVVKGRFDRNSHEYETSIFKSLGDESTINTLIEILNPEVMKNIETEVEQRVEKYIEEHFEEHQNDSQVVA